MAFLQVSNERYENLIDPNNIIELSLIETIGNILPMFTLTFSDTDFSKLQYLNEKNPITIGYQIENRMVTNEFIIKPVNPVIGAMDFNCSIGGYLNKFEYFKGIPKVPYVNGTSVEAIRQIASAYFSIEIGELNTDDSMIWLHNGKNARNFIQDIWKHMYSPTSLPILGIDLNGIFKLKDMITLVSQEPKYQFANIVDDESHLYVTAEVSDNINGNTSLYGYTSEREVLLEGSMEQIKSSVTPKLIMNTSIQMNEAEMPTRKLAPMFQSTNVHRHWYEAYHQNFVKWSSLNSNTLTLTTFNDLLPLSIMDLIYVKFPQKDTTSRSSDGNFIISQKKIQFDNRGNVIITYTGIREAPQNVSSAEDIDTQEFSTYKI